ncbi:hypothetical protein FHS60_000980 [Alloprevotella rava]|uniref:Uncharacterized protein n=1 Tax=Alloprevotella rava TaxID=671218 RepID=A0A7W5UM44_9BACT|nr:hypothetical protein [Alloprevotella rava]
MDWVRDNNVTTKIKFLLVGVIIEATISIHHHQLYRTASTSAHAYLYSLNACKEKNKGFIPKLYWC